MSAFLVSHETVDVILTALQLRDGETLARLFAPFTAPEDPRDALDDLGRQILALNLEALRARYGGNEEDDAETAAGYTFSARPESPGYVVKQLDCLTYQCAEGDVPSHPLYVALEAMRRALVDRVLNDLPAYVAAPWGAR